MNFGLGLVLSFTDNATAGINNAVNSLNQLTQTAERASASLDQMASLSALSVVSSQIGNSFVSMGQNIISTLGQVISKVNATGQTLMYADNQLSKLYEGSGRTGKEVLAQIQDYAKKSIFEFEDLISVVTSLKTVGIEAFDEIASSAGNTYDVLSLASDLAAFNPNMMNMYGTGINAAMGSLREYIAEGNEMSLKRAAGLDLTGILGEKKGSTIEERSRQVADLLEKLGMVGLTAQMANSPMTKLSNMSDTLFQFLSMVSQSGVYDKVNELITKFAEFVGSIPDEELLSLANAVGSALTTIMKPLEWLTDVLLSFASSLRKLLANNPELATLATVFVTLAGVLMIFAGIALKITSALSGLSLMLLTFGASYSSIGGLLKAGSLKILGVLLPLTAKIGLLLLAWKSDFLGIRSIVTYFVGGIVGAFRNASKAVNGSVEDLISTLDNLNNKNDFFSNLTIGIMKFMTLFGALSEAWSNNTLSEETFLKARELGILPLIEAILDLKYRFGLFLEGFAEGWRQIGDVISSFMKGLIDSVKGSPLEPLIDALTVLFQKLSGGEAQSWYNFGKSFALITAGVLTLVTAIKAVGIITSIVGMIKSAISTVKIFIDGVIGLFNLIVTTVKFVYSTLGSVTNIIKALFTPLSSFLSIFSGIAIAVGAFIAQLTGGFSMVLEVIKWIGLAIAGVGAVALGLVTAPVAAIIAVVAGAVTLLIELIVTFWEEITSFFSSIGSWINDNVIQPVVEFFAYLFNVIESGFVTAFNAVKSFLGTVANWIYNNLIMPLIDFFKEYLYPIIEKIVEIVAKVIEIVSALVNAFVMFINTNVVQPVIQFFQTLWNSIVTTFQNVVSWFSSLFQSAVEGIKSAFSVLSDFCSMIWESVKNAFNNVVEWFGGIFSSAVEAIKSFFSPLAGFFRGVWKEIVSVFTSIGTVIANAISGAVKNAINTVLKGATSIINGFIDSLNFAIGVINTIPNVNVSRLSRLEVPALAEGGVVENPTLSVIGEAGKEAVVPLENNTEWVGKIASMIYSQLENIRPTSTNSTYNTNNSVNKRYLTNNATTTNQTIHGDTDNSIVFNQGAIQITVQNASEAEATRMAKTIMEYIKRQGQLDRMAQYSY